MENIYATLLLHKAGKEVNEANVKSIVAAAGIEVDEYVALDVNIAWKVTETLELMLAGQNLLESNHLEFVNEYFVPPTEVGQSFYCKLTWEF